MKYKRTYHNIAIFIIVAMILSMSVICIELIAIKMAGKEEDKFLKNVKLNINRKKNTFDTSNLDFENIKLDEEKKYIKDLCEHGCNIESTIDDHNFQYVIQKDEGEYILNVVYDSRILLSDKKLGTSLDKAYFIFYLNSILLFNEIHEDMYTYDYATTVNYDASLDEFSSLGSEELEFTEAGIIYYYDVCRNVNESKDKFIKAIRMPYSLKAHILDTTESEFSWCEKEDN